MSGDTHVKVTLLYSEGCPNWLPAAEAITQALTHLGLPSTALTLQGVDTIEEAKLLSFLGSPSILINGSDPFAEPGAAIGLTCRLYPTDRGAAGAPSQDQLIEALHRGMAGIVRAAQKSHERKASPAGRTR